MWRSTVSEPIEADTSSLGGRRAIALFRGGKKQAASSGGKGPAVEQESPSVFKKLLEARNDADAQRSPKEYAMQRKKKKWHMLKKALATDEDGDKALHEPESSSSLRSLSGGSIGSNVFADQRQTKVVIHQFSSANPKDVMQLEREDAIPSPETRSHVVVRVQASSVTLNDCLLRRGHDFSLMNPATLPLTPGHDVVGKIIAVGLDVKDFKEGDRVAALVRTGGNARYASAPEASLVRVPQALNAAEAACMVTVYSAAYQSLKMVVSEGPMFSLRGKKVLVIGGMSDIGQAVVQMCNKARADVYATAPSRRHAYVIGTLGALPLPEDSQDWLPRVEGEMDVVFDGQCADGLEAAKKAVKKGGNVIWFGYSSMIKEEMGLFGPPIKAHLNRLFSVKCVDIWDHFQRDPESYKKHLVSLFQLLKWNKLRPHIAKRIALTDVAFAHSKLETGEVRGCVICMPWKHVAARRIAKDLPTVPAAENPIEPGEARDSQVRKWSKEKGKQSEKREV